MLVPQCLLQRHRGDLGQERQARIFLHGGKFPVGLRRRKGPCSSECDAGRAWRPVSGSTPRGRSRTCAQRTLPPRLVGVCPAPIRHPHSYSIEHMVVRGWEARRGGMDATGPSAVAFWPPSVARLIGAYQARLEQETAAAAGPPRAGTSPGPRPRTGRPRRRTRDTTGGPHRAATSRSSRPGRQSRAALAVPPPDGRARPASGLGGAASSPGAAAGQRGRAVTRQPRGYLAGNGVPGGSAGWLPARRTGRRSPGATAPLPASMVTAVRLMYAGAAYALVWAIGVDRGLGQHRQAPSGRHRERRSPPGRGGDPGRPAVRRRDRALARHRAGLPGAAAAAPGWPARCCSPLHTVGVLGVVASSQAGLGPAKVLTLIGWLIGLGAVVALWQRPSSAFFNARAPVSR